MVLDVRTMLVLGDIFIEKNYVSFPIFSWLPAGQKWWFIVSWSGQSSTD